MTRLHAEELERAKAASVPFMGFRLSFGDLWDQFPVRDIHAVIDIFLSCEAANGFEIFTNIAIHKECQTFGDRSASFRWKGLNVKPRVRYWRLSEEVWVSHT